MKTMQTTTGLLLGAVMLGGPAQGALINAGNGLINDTTQNLVWTQDANLAASNSFGLTYGADLGTYPGDTSGVHGTIYGDGTMNWPGARFWIDAMNLANYKGYHEWRLWQVTDTDSPGCNGAYTGTDCGWNVDLATGELAHLWYDSLGNLAYYDTSGNPDQPGWGLSNTGPFTNMPLSPYKDYWSGTQYAPNPPLAWNFNADGGQQYFDAKVHEGHGWAVRSGQVADAPLPATGFLVALGLLALGASRRARRATLALR